jgi:hypothetical protein
MAPWELHEMFPSLDIKNVSGYPNHFSLDWGDNCPKFDGDPSLAITHVVKFLKYTSEINVIHEDVLIRFFLLSLEARQKNWVKHSLSPKSISSLTFSLKNFSSIGAQDLKGMKIFFMILYNNPSKKRDSFLTLLKMMKT